MKNWKQAALCATALGLSPSAMAQDASQEPVDEIVVIGTDQGRYRIEDSGALTGFQLDFLELPRVVNVIPEQLVLDQKITDLNEALRNTPGVSQSDGFGGTNDDFFIRGFRRNAVFRNGFRRGTSFKTNLTNTEYIQIVRGPASITYGQVEPGGLVDIITKKPLEEQRISGEARWGSFSDHLYLIDWSQPLTDKLGVRVVASSQDSDSFRELTDIRRDAVSISARFDATDSTRIDLAYEYLDESRPLDRGTITVPTPDGRKIINTLTDIPISRRFGEPFEIYETSFHFFDAIVEQDIGDNWKLRLGAAYEDSTSNDLQARPKDVYIFDADTTEITPDGFFLTQPTAAELRALRRDAVFDDPTDLVFLSRTTDGNRDSNSEVFYVNANLSGEFQTGSLQHRVAIGGDYRDSKSSNVRIDSLSTNGTATSVEGGTGPLFNIRNPIYGNLPDVSSTELFISQKREGSNLSYGAFINDYIDITNNISVLIGLRYDFIDSATSQEDFDAKSAVSPQLALNYKFTDNISTFLSYSESFIPNIGLDFSDSSNIRIRQFDPEEGEQYEIGTKAEFFENRLQATFALYQIAKRNVLSTSDLTGEPVLIDGQTSQGLEISVSGQPIPGLNIVAGYAYTDAEIDEGPGKANTGNRPRNLAENTFNLWASYEVQSGKFEGLGVGAGAFHSGDRFGNSANTYHLGSHTTADLSTWYTVAMPGLDPDQTMRFQLSVRNIFDEEFYTASGADIRTSIGTPRTIFGSVSFEF
ncbi:MAG: TonB-dependent siderophore receptor [Pseudomonadota bacterium]